MTRILILPSVNSFGNVPQMCVDLALTNLPAKFTRFLLSENLFPVAGAYFNGVDADSLAASLAEFPAKQAIPVKSPKLSLGMELYATEIVDRNGVKSEVHILQIRSTPIDSQMFCDELIRDLCENYEHVVCLASAASAYATAPLSSGSDAEVWPGVHVFSRDKPPTSENLIGSGLLAKRILTKCSKPVTVIAKFCPDEGRENVQDAQDLFSYLLAQQLDMSAPMPAKTMKMPTSWNCLFGNLSNASEIF